MDVATSDHAAADCLSVYEPEHELPTPKSLEAQFFATLNRYVEPAVRAGVGSPWIWPTGLIVLDSTGRRTGRKHRVPVAATVLGPQVVLASTVRAGRSQWLKNLTMTPELTYWLLGREHAATAIVFAPGALPPEITGLPALFRPLAPTLSFWTRFGIGFAVLISVKPGPPGE
jgi:hypothetical protein